MQYSASDEHIKLTILQRQNEINRWDYKDRRSSCWHVIPRTALWREGILFELELDFEKKEKISIDRGGMIGDRSKKGESLLIWESSISKGRVNFDKDENLEISGEGSVSYESFTIIEV